MSAGHPPGARKRGRRRFCGVQAFWPQAKTLADCARRRVSERNRRSAAALGAEMAEFISAEHLDHRRVERANGLRNPKRKTRQI